MTTELFGCRPGDTNSLMDVAGLGVGHAVCEDEQGDSGTTVIVAPGGAVAGVDVRGGGPGTRETDLLEPHNTVQAVHAIALSGGSAFGLDAAGGVMAELESRGIGFPVLGDHAPDKIVPIVPSAVIFDLLLGRWDSRPDAGTGALAAQRALAAYAGEAVELATESGNVGAGLAASAGALKGGFGQASATFPEGSPLAGVTIAAGVVANPQGAVIDPRSGQLWGSASVFSGEMDTPQVSRDAAEALRGMNILGTKITPQMLDTPQLNTTIGVIATNATLTKAQCTRLAMGGHDGLARAIRPAHMPMDGDTLFTLATGHTDVAVDPVALSMLTAASANVVERAIVHAVLAADSAFGVPSYRDVLANPSGLASNSAPDTTDRTSRTTP
ncbi:peptidase S58 family protein [Corynebacterium sp. zg254]|uniref:P1 family peptidase n=1 Tax=Corynebacterium zhongnanshanii TaxID=2768834 RepID=A0ABQ6VDJ6_9CORY|nr:MULTISPECIES: P1 family peptidase [Corynebacterium]KAB3520988.1 P1 family peptidase [Corynebacterium zhongnanshanii]MCR5914625.1 peptidase S58 family protein [Corynebacterium sp. zg254]